MQGPHQRGTLQAFNFMSIGHLNYMDGLHSVGLTICYSEVWFKISVLVNSL